MVENADDMMAFLAPNTTHEAANELTHSCDSKTEPLQEFARHK